MNANFQYFAILFCLFSFNNESFKLSLGGKQSCSHPVRISKLVNQ